MPGYSAAHIQASEVLTALGVLAVAQEEDRPVGEIDSLTGDVLNALDGYRESAAEVAA